jgi:hypothetical protein
MLDMVSMFVYIDKRRYKHCPGDPPDANRFQPVAWMIATPTNRFRSGTLQRQHQTSSAGRTSAHRS